MVDSSIEVRDIGGHSFKPFRVSGKANILFAAGRKDEGFKVADQAIAKGKADKKDTASFEKRVADLKSGKM